MIYKALLLHLFVFLSIATYAQTYDVTIYGPPSAIVGNSDPYDASPAGTDIDMVTWDAGSHGWADPYTESDATIQWLLSGYAKITYEAQDIHGYYYGEKDVTVTPPTPDATVTNVSYTCGKTAVTRSYLSPYEDHEWYWQTSSSGTSTTLGSDSVIDLPASTPLYLRARDKATLIWSSSQSLGNYTVYTQAPSTSPASQAYKIIARDITLQTDAVSNTLEYNWYDDSQVYITSTSSPSYTVTASSSVKYYVSAKNPCGESSKATISLDVAPKPVINSANGGVNIRQEDVLSLNYNYEAYAWRKSGDTTVLSTASSYTTDEKGTYTVTVTYGSESQTASFELKDAIETVNQNYIISDNILMAVKDTSHIDTLSIDHRSRTIQYFDGLGRPMQQVNQQASPAKKDIVVPVEYDQFGRQAKDYLPYLPGTNNGLYKESALNTTDYSASDHYKYYDDPLITDVARDQMPFARKYFEASPLNRILKQGAPGADWQPDTTTGPTDLNDHSIKFSYQINDSTDSVKMWKVSDDGFPYYEDDYDTAQLYKNITYDEKGDQVIEFRDKLGQAVLKAVQVNAEQWANTYYVYDDFGRLRYVLPPEVDKRLKQDTVSQVPADHYTGQHVYFHQSQIITDNNKDSLLGTPAPTLTVWTKSNKTLTLEEPYTFTANDTTNIIYKMGTPLLDLEMLYGLAFQYHYDSRGRMVAKKVPGADWVFMVYDQWDRLVLTQDGNQRLEKKWTFTKYDVLNRPVITGIMIWDRPHDELQEWLYSQTNSGVIGRYESFYDSLPYDYSLVNSFPVDGNSDGYTIIEDEILSIIFYDEYKSSDTAGYNPPPSGTFDTTAPLVEPVKNENVKGQITGTKTKILGGTNQWIVTTNYYDDRYRLIQTISENQYQGLTDTLSTQYDFSGQVRHTYQAHTKGGLTTTIQRKYEYDHAGRLEKVHHNVGADPFILLVENEYNELGELIDKKLHSEDNTTFAQSVDYRYNIRGWLTRINDSELETETNAENDYFGMNLGYNDDIGLSATPAFNGNISAVKWNNISEEKKGYAYNYDTLNRIKKAQYKVTTGTWASATKFTVDNLNYDLNGNIKSLTRKDRSGSDLDVLAYDYTKSGNQLNYVTDSSANNEGFKDGNTSGNDYFYDANGNMVKDLNKGITNIGYNYLNLPSVVTKDAKNYIEYIYDAAGIKLRQIVHRNDTVKTTDYAGEFIYEDDNLQFIQHEEGRVIPASKSVSAKNEYQYHLKDHLGNTRLSFTTMPNAINFIVNYEGLGNDDMQLFELDTTTIISNDIFDHTDATGTVYTKTQMLNGTDGSILGTHIPLTVGKGDTINAKVYAKYAEVTPNSTNTTTSIASALISAFTSSSLGNLSETGTSVVNQNFNDASLIGTIEFPFENENAPRAYLNLIFIPEYGSLDLVKDVSFAYDQIDGGSSQLIGEPKNQNFDEMRIDNFVAPAQGYIVIYLSNESGEVVEVYFDDIEIDINEHHVIQVDDYYPFGLTFNSYQRSTAKENKFKYNSFEEQTELDWGVYDYKARYYDPAIGRFLQVDPAADLMRRHSPYNYAFDNPIRFIDPDGMMPEELQGPPCPEPPCLAESRLKYNKLNGGGGYGGGDDGNDCPDCPGYVEGEQNSDMELPAVVITPNKNSGESFERNITTPEIGTGGDDSYDRLNRINPKEEPTWNWITKQLKKLPLNEQAEKDWNRFFGTRRQRDNFGQKAEGVTEFIIDSFIEPADGAMRRIFFPPVFIPPGYVNDPVAPPKDPTDL